MIDERRGRTPSPQQRALPDDALDIVATRLRVMAEPTRVRLMWLLDREGGATVQEMCDALPTKTIQTISKHLGLLFQVGLVSRAREGGRMRYELIDWTALWVIDQVVVSVAAQLDAQQQRFPRSR